MQDEFIQRADLLTSQFERLADAGTGLLDGPDDAVPPWIIEFVQLCATCSSWMHAVRAEKKDDSCFNEIQQNVYDVINSYSAHHHDITEDMVKTYLDKCNLLVQEFQTWVSQEKTQKTGNPYCVRIVRDVIS